MRNGNMTHYIQVIHKSKFFNAYPDQKTAGDVLWSHIHKRTCDPDLAELLTKGILKLHPETKPWRRELTEVRREERDDKLLNIRDRRALRNAIGNAPVDALKSREKQAEQNHRSSFAGAWKIADKDARNIILESALKQWNDEKLSLQYDYMALCYGGKDKLDAARKKFDDQFGYTAPTKNQTQPATQRGRIVDRKPGFRSPDHIDNNRNITLHKMACSLFAKNFGADAVWAALQAENDEKCHKPLDLKELRDIFKSSRKRHSRNQEKLNAGRPERFTDLANAIRLVDEHGDIIRYIPAYKKWSIFYGARWLKDPPGGMFNIVRETLEDLYQYAMIQEGDERSRLFKEIIGLESIQKQRAMIDMASTLPSIIAEPSQFDGDPLLLNVNNGTLDLRTGCLRGQDPSDLISKLAPVVFDPSAQCPIWEATIAKIMGGNTNLIAFLQRALGYSLTGNTGEQCFFIAYGSGANGKSTVLKLLAQGAHQKLHRFVSAGVALLLELAEQDGGVEVYLLSTGGGPVTEL
jgi:hypothetical protein